MAQLSKHYQPSTPFVTCGLVVTKDKDRQDSCSVEVQVGGRSAILSRQDECGGDSCSVSNWVVTNAPRALALPGNDGHGGDLEGGDKVVTPDGRHVIADLATLRGGKLGDWEVRLVKISLATGKISRFADCMSPALSPAGRWILCRGRDGSVLKVPLSGGQPQMVAPSGLSPDKIDFVPWSAAYPQRVFFSSDTRAVYDLHAPGGELLATRSFDWHE